MARTAWPTASYCCVTGRWLWSYSERSRAGFDRGGVAAVQQELGGLMYLSPLPPPSMSLTNRPKRTSACSISWWPSYQGFLGAGPRWLDQQSASFLAALYSRASFLLVIW